jgi:ABC-type nitrate/sulfonate/bicarbonate transport system substrate-binding protein
MSRPGWKRILPSIMMGIALSSSNCEKTPRTADHDLPTLTVGIQVSPAMTLVMVAQDKGLFENAGVKVLVKEFTAGKFALQAFLGGSLDLAVSGEVPVTLAVLQGNKFRVVAQVVERTRNECRVVVRRDGRLDTPEAYFHAKKRRLATSFGGGPEFFTYNFMLKHKIADHAVELISQRPEDMPAALASGSVDAISVFDPFARIAEIMTADRSLTFSDPEIYSELYVVAVRQETLSQGSDRIQAFLRGIHEASKYVERHPDESKAVLLKYTKLNRSIVDDIWGNFVFRPAINSLFVEYTTAEARWFVQKGTFPSDTAIPDFDRVLAPELLKRVDPALVSFTRN